jgi:hypothetical protein
MFDENETFVGKIETVAFSKKKYRQTDRHTALDMD